MPSITYKKKVVSVRRSSSANVRTTKTGRKFKVFKTERTPSPKRNISVRAVSPTHNAFKKKSLSPRRATTATGRKILIWTESKAPSGRVYAIQTVLPASRPPMNR